MSGEQNIDILKFIIAPDPSDFVVYNHANHGRSRLVDGEGKLWLCLFEGAVIDLLRPIRKQHHREALEWVQEEKDCPGSFNFVCETLGLSPTATRRELMKALEARGGPAFVVRHSGPKKTPKLKGAKLCQQRQVSIEPLPSVSMEDSTCGPTNLRLALPTAPDAECGAADIQPTAAC